MASKSIFVAVSVLLVHVFTSSRRAVCQLEHLRSQIYTLYTFYTAIKEGFATTSMDLAGRTASTAGWAAVSGGGSGGGGETIPEPTSGLLLLVGGAMLALRRKQK